MFLVSKYSSRTEMVVEFNVYEREEEASSIASEMAAELEGDVSIIRDPSSTIITDGIFIVTILSILP